MTSIAEVNDYYYKIFSKPNLREKNDNILHTSYFCTEKKSSVLSYMHQTFVQICPGLNCILKYLARYRSVIFVKSIVLLLLM